MVNFLPTQLHCLRAMGISAWQRRSPSVVQALTLTTHAQTQVPIESITSWDSLCESVASCQLCTLCTTRTQTVFGQGNRQAKWLFIGEAPGKNEDEQGLAFVGEAGQLLTEMLRAMNLTREDVFIANILKCRPPNNRPPTQEEVECCMPFLVEQIALIQPQIMVALGRTAAQALLKTQQPIGKLVGQVFKFENTPLLVTYHPAYLLREAKQKTNVWKHLQVAIKMMA